MNARIALNQYGSALIGREIATEAIGEYPGGLAKVIELNPDPGAPEIVFQVKHPTFGEIGIVDHEEVFVRPAHL